MERVGTKWAHLGVAIAAAVLLPSAADADPVRSVIGAPEGTVALAVDDLFDNKISFDLHAYEKQSVVVYSLTESIEARFKGACQLAVPDAGKPVVVDKDSPAACRDLLLSDGEIKHAVSKTDSLGYIAITRPQLKSFAGSTTEVLVPVKGTGERREWDSPAFAKTTVSLAGPATGVDCYLKVQKSWMPVTCAMASPPPEPVAAPTEAKPAPKPAPPPGARPAVAGPPPQTLSVTIKDSALVKIVNTGLTAGGTFTLAAKVLDKDSPPTGEWRTFSMKGAPPPAEEQSNCPPAPPVPFDQICVHAAQKLLAETPVKDPPTTLSEAARPGRETSPFYAICVDSLDVASPTIQAFEISSGTTPEGTVSKKGVAPIANLRFDTRRSFQVFVRYPKGHKIDLTFSGTPGEGWASETHDSRPPLVAPAEVQPSGDQKKEPKKDCPPKPVEDNSILAQFPQLAQLAGTVTLRLKVSRIVGDDTIKDISSRDWKLAVDNHVRFAVRLGLGVLWQPWAQRVEEVVSPGGVHYTAVTGGNGDPRGLYNVEFMAGVTWFPWAISETAIEPHFGIGAYLGVLALKENTLEGLTSFSLGPELAIGPDFSLGFLAGFHRTEVPKSGYEPGHVIPTGKSYDKDGKQPWSFTPSFGLVMNFTPTMFKSIFK